MLPFSQPEMGTNLSPEATRKVASVAWWAMLSPLPVYGLVCYWVQAKAATEGGRVLFLPLLGLAALLVFVSPIVERRLERSMTGRVAKSGSEGTPPGEAEWRSAFYQGALQLITVMAALGECVALYGVLLAFFGAPVRFWLPFLAISFCHLVWYKGKHSSYFRRADERARDAVAGYSGG